MGNTTFLKEWLEMPQFHSIRESSKSNRYAYCILCNKEIFLSNMGPSALTSHIKSSKHSTREEARKNTHSMQIYNTKKNQIPALQESRENKGEDESTKIITDDQQISISKTNNSSSATTASNVLDKFLIKEDVSKAEILWCLQSVFSHLSLNAAGNSTKMFPLMFPDSKIASNLQLSRTKLSYAIVFGLSLYFHDTVKQEISQSDCYVVYFDESLNKMAQMQQMDVAIRFWSKTRDEVCTRYFSSAFLRRATATDLLEAFKAEVEPLDFKRLLHISMDGPNVNFKFLRDLESYLLEKHDVEDPRILSMGTCGLHVVSNGFKNGINATNWTIVQFLRSIYNIFKDVPSRRNDFITYSGCSQFPKKFSSSRWLENAPIAERALLILPSLQKYAEGVKKDKKEPTSNSYMMVVKCLKDPFIGAKLAFFSHVAYLMEPFLVEFQSDAPLAPFLFTELTILMTDLMDMFIKKEILEKTNSVHKIDLENEENFIFTRNMKLGYAVESELRKIKNITEKDKLLFKNQCRTMLIMFCKKLLERSPLKYKLCKAITFCDPILISDSQAVCISRLKTTLEIFLEKKWLSARDCDNIEKEFKLLIKNSAIIDVCKTFTRKTERIDHFWKNIWKHHDASILLISFMKKVMLISHGNAFVERGFSINKELIVENQQSKSLIAQRRVYDGIQVAGGVENVQITPKMMSQFRNSRMQYSLAMEEKKKESKSEVEESLQRKRIRDEVDQLKEKKRRVMVENQKEIDSIENQI